jgi:hypothetical protein
MTMSGRWPEQYHLRIDRDNGCAQHHRADVPMPPGPRCDKSANPNAGLGRSGYGFIRIVPVAVSDERHGPAVPHHPLPNILAINLTGRKASPVSIGAADVARAL